MSSIKVLAKQAGGQDPVAQFRGCGRTSHFADAQGIGHAGTETGAGKPTKSSIQSFRHRASARILDRGPAFPRVVRG